MMGFLASLHEVLRGLIVVGGAAGLVVSLIRGRRTPEPPSRPLSRLFLAFLDTGWALGWILWLVDRPPGRLVHGIVMTLAVVLGHVLFVLARTREPLDSGRYALAYGLTLVALLLGHLTLPGGGLP